MLPRLPLMKSSSIFVRYRLLASYRTRFLLDIAYSRSTPITMNRLLVGAYRRSCGEIVLIEFFVYRYHIEVDSRSISALGIVSNSILARQRLLIKKKKESNSILVVGCIVSKVSIQGSIELRCIGVDFDFRSIFVTNVRTRCHVHALLS